MTQPTSGWYRDPVSAGTERWWDGEQWSPVTRLAPEPISPSEDFALDGPSGGWTARPGQLLAAPGPRLLARLIDLVITSAAAQLAAGNLAQPAIEEMDSVVTQLGQGVRQPVYDVQAMLVSLAMFTAVLLVIRGFYQVTLIKAYGATLGKRLAGVRVVGVDGAAVGWGAAFRRWLARDVWRLAALVPLLGLPALLYYVLDSVWCLRDPRRQAIHDKAARTVVIRAKNSAGTAAK